MKKLSTQFEEILREATRKAVAIEYIRDALLEAVKERDEKVFKTPKEYGVSAMTTLKQKMEESL